MSIVKFFRDPRTQQRIMINDCPKSNSSPSDPQLNMKFGDRILVSEEDLPIQVDLREKMTPIENQQEIRSWYVSNMILDLLHVVYMKFSLI